MNGDRDDFRNRIGVGEPSRAFLTRHGTSRRQPVVGDEGPRRGQVVGSKTEHWDGRVDATAQPDVVRTTRTKEST